MDIGSLLQAGSTLAGGIAEGEQRKRELERRARMDMLAQRLQDAQIANYQSEAQRRTDQTAYEQARLRALAQPHDPAARLVQDDNGDWVWMMPPAAHPAAPSVTPGVSPTVTATAPTPGPTVVPTGVHGPKKKSPTPARVRTVTTYTNDGRAIITPIDNAGHPGTPDTLSSGRAPTTQQLTSGSQVAAAETAAQTLHDVATRDPDAFSAAITFIRAKRHRRLGGDLVSEARGALTNADAQRAVQAYNAYLLATIPNARPNETTLDIESEASLPAVGSDRSTWANALRTIDERVAGLRLRAGRAAPSGQGGLTPPGFLLVPRTP